MYFSSQEYTEPDVVCICGNSVEMLSMDEDDIHSDMSYRNMTYNPSTVLVLVDQTKDLVSQGIRSVNAARPVAQLVSPKTYPFSGVSTHRAEIDSSAAILDGKIVLEESELNPLWRKWTISSTTFSDALQAVQYYP